VSRRPKKTPPDKRILAATSVIFARSPVTPLPGFSGEYHAALKASHDGEARHAERVAGMDWRAVYDTFVEAGHASELTAPIRSDVVARTLKKLSPKNAHLAPAFIKWVRRNM